jgi:hypothetical protein
MHATRARGTIKRHMQGIPWLLMDSGMAGAHCQMPRAVHHRTPASHRSTHANNTVRSRTTNKCRTGDQSGLSQCQMGVITRRQKQQASLFTPSPLRPDTPLSQCTIPPPQTESQTVCSCSQLMNTAPVGKGRSWVAALGGISCTAAMRTSLRRLVGEPRIVGLSGLVLKV